MNIGIFGIGEAGSLIADDLAKLNISVKAFDPADVATPNGVMRVASPLEVVSNIDILLAITAGHDAETAMNQAVNVIPHDIIYADLSTNSTIVKRNLADIASSYQFKFVDVALMSTVPGKGLRTPMLASGDGAKSLKTLWQKLPVSIDVVSEFAGDAANRKLLRSIVMKGLAATVIEALNAAEKANCLEWLWNNVCAEIEHADQILLKRLVHGTSKHAVRRTHEMEAVLAMLTDLGASAAMTEATINSLMRVHQHGIPSLKKIDHAQD